jgi:quercetin dioxygenase-like cupin family protein
MDLLQLQNRIIKLTELKEFVSLEIFRDQFLNLQLEGFDRYVQFKTDNYNSITLYSTFKFEIRLLCWKPLQETPKHPHPQNGCLMKILQGKLTEEKFLANSSIMNVYNKGDVGYIKASELHILKNLDTDTVSLHIYSPGGFYDNAIKA